MNTVKPPLERGSDIPPSIEWLELGSWLYVVQHEAVK